MASVSDNESVATVPERVLDECAHVLIDKIDRLLDRVTDRAVPAPTPGSAAWELEWSVRVTPIGRTRMAERSCVREELARRAFAGLDIAEGSAPAARGADCGDTGRAAAPQTFSVYDSQRQSTSVDL